MTSFVAPRRMSLERQLQFAYIAAFAVVIAAFAFASRLSFERSLQEQTLSRLVTLARAGTASVAFTDRGFVVDAESLGGFTTIDKDEGLEWFDVHKNRVARRGLTTRDGSHAQEGAAVIDDGNMSLQTYTMPLLTPGGSLRGYVRALESSAVMQRSEHPLDLALLVGGLIATLAAAGGGALLARASVARTEDTVKRLTEFTADAAHELRGPLTALATTTSAAMREAALPEVTQARLASILELGNAMRRLVDDLLVLARAGQPLERDIFVIDVPSVVRRVRDRFVPAAEGKGLQLELECPSAIQMYGNEDQVERIVTNLVDNAVRYTQAGGRIRIVCGEEAGFVVLAVEDTGPGIQPQHQRKVFDRFWRADEVRSPESGTGLGLAIAQALARRHGGDIDLASQPPYGSTFTLKVPRN